MKATNKKTITIELELDYDTDVLTPEQVEDRMQAIHHDTWIETSLMLDEIAVKWQTKPVHNGEREVDSVVGMRCITTN